MLFYVKSDSAAPFTYWLSRLRGYPSIISTSSNWQKILFLNAAYIADDFYMMGFVDMK